MKYITYYTVITGKRACIVKYAQGPAYDVKLLKGAFADPGEASKVFKIATAGDLEYLEEKAFDRTVGTLSTRYQQDLMRLADWNSGRKIRV